MLYERWKRKHAGSGARHATEVVDSERHEDSTREGADAIPLEPGREWDKPSGKHVGPAAALRVPTSEGPASFEFDRGDVSQQELISAEPALEPLRMMEAGLEYDEPTRRVVHELDRPIKNEF